MKLTLQLADVATELSDYITNTLKTGQTTYSVLYISELPLLVFGLGGKKGRVSGNGRMEHL